MQLKLHDSFVTVVTWRGRLNPGGHLFPHGESSRVRPRRFSVQRPAAGPNPPLLPTAAKKRTTSIALAKFESGGGDHRVKLPSFAERSIYAKSTRRANRPKSKL
jgi:hypothetical protein